MGETTEIFRRKVRHWKTTAAGLAVIALGVVPIIWPETAIKCAQISAFLTGAGFLMAADGNKQSTP